MELLNRTKVEVNIDTGQVTTKPPPTVTTPTVTTPTVTTPTVTTPTVTTPSSVLTKDQLLSDIATATGTQYAGEDPLKVAAKFVERAEAVDELLTGTGKWGEAFGQLTADQIAEALAGLPNLHKGGTIATSGIAQVHAGETITPRGGGVNIVVNVEGSGASERDLGESIRKGLLRAQQSGKAVVL